MPTRVSHVLGRARDMLYNPMYLAQIEPCGTGYRLLHAVHDAAKGDLSLTIGALQAIQPLITAPVSTVQAEQALLDAAEQVSKVRELAAMSTVLSTDPVSTQGSNGETLSRYQDALAGAGVGKGHHGNTQ